MEFQERLWENGVVSCYNQSWLFFFLLTCDCSEISLLLFRKSRKFKLRYFPCCWGSASRGWRNYTPGWVTVKCFEINIRFYFSSCSASTLSAFLINAHVRCSACYEDVHNSQWASWVNWCVLCELAVFGLSVQVYCNSLIKRERERDRTRVN